MNRIRTIILVGLLVGLIGCGGHLTLAERFEQVQVGWTTSQVLDLMGVPNKVVGDQHGVVSYIWIAEDQTFTIQVGTKTTWVIGKYKA